MFEMNKIGDKFEMLVINLEVSVRIPTVKLKIPGKAFLKSEIPGIFNFTVGILVSVANMMKSSTSQ